MRVWGTVTFVVGLLVMGYALTLDTSVSTNGSGYSAYPYITPSLPSQVSNLRLLQQQLIWFIAGGIVGLAGVTMLCAATILDAFATKPIAIVASPPENATQPVDVAESADWTPPADDGKNDMLIVGIAFAGFLALVVIFLLFARH